ncbi:hypothetical protein Taro_045000 [Colocasia esculenta]|uniref:Uncharacterized protein n=1 Tax=Colocasia esculenta TaxID=4460 RepID=A0A843WVZ1_COLES|nr:hypothetical protein [Colocasia esculenta]
MLKHMTAMHKDWRGMLKLKYYKGKTFDDVVTSVPPTVDQLDWQTMCEKWNTREKQDIAERNRQNRAHQSMTYLWGRMSIYQLRDDFVKTHQHVSDHMEIFRMGRCKDLPDGTQWWVDDESNDHFVREDDPDDDSCLQSDDVAPVSAEDTFIHKIGLAVFIARIRMRCSAIGTGRERDRVPHAATTLRCSSCNSSCRIYVRRGAEIARR